MAGSKTRYITSSDLFSIHFIPTLIVFLVMMLLIGFSWRTAAQVIEDTENEQIDIRAQFVETSLKERTEAYENVLRSGAGVIRGSDPITHKKWELFIAGLDVENRFPAAIGFGYAKIVKANELNTHIASVNAEGFADYTLISPNPPRDVYVPVTYIEPLNDRNRTVLGGDIYNDPERKLVIDYASENNSVSVTGVVPIKQPDGGLKHGVYAYYPVYSAGLPISTAEERRAAVTGYIYMPFIADDLFEGIFKGEDESFNVEVYSGDDSSEANLLYRRYESDKQGPYRYVRSGSIRMNNQTWNIIYSARLDIVPEAIRTRPNSIAIGGIVFSLLVAGLVYLLLQRRSRHLAEAENRKLENAKDSMLSLASHQLRTPATGVKQYLGMVLEGFVGDITKEQKEMLQKANDSNERQLRIINEFLYLAKADADRVIISPQKFDLGELAHNVAADMQSEVLQAGHTISIKQRAKLVPVVADLHSTRMILENLISNAIKYTPAGGKIKVVVCKHHTDSSVCVEDNGVGIDKKDMKKLFLQFSRITNELTRQEAGSGIGLYLSKYLAELNGGKIQVASVRHKGSTFTVYLPNKTVKNITAQE